MSPSAFFDSIKLPYKNKPRNGIQESKL